MRLVQRVSVVALSLGLLGLTACGHHADNPQKRGLAVRAPVRITESVIRDPTAAPQIHVYDLAGALRAVQAIWARFPHPTPAPVQRRSAPPTTSLPVQVVPQGQDYHRDGDWPIWRAIGRCEQPGPGVDGIAWTHGPGSTYPGGLGIFSGAWSDYHGEAGVPVSNGAYASPEQQMMVARVIRAHHGLSAWGCAKMVGL